MGQTPCSVTWPYIFLQSENPAGDERDVGPRGGTGPLPYPAPADVWRTELSVHFALSSSASIFHKLGLRQESGCGLTLVCLHFCGRQLL